MEKASAPELKLRIRIVQEGEVVLGPGRADLLALIQSSGSIAAAGRQMHMSYKRAWVLVEAMNKTFSGPLVEAAKGGPGGGGAKLTALGLEVLGAYRELQEDCRKAAASPLQRMQRVLPVSPRSKSA